MNPRILPLLALIPLGACAALDSVLPRAAQAPAATAAAAAPAAPPSRADAAAANAAGLPAPPPVSQQPLDATPPPPPPAGASTAEELDTTTQEDRAAALAAPPTDSAPAGRLGTTVASLGPPAEPGIWLETPLVSAVTMGRVEYQGKTIAIELRPSGGEPGSGSQISIAAMRLLGAPLTGLPELVVYGS